MRIIRDEEAGTFTFIPVTRKEVRKVRRIAKILKPRQKLVYGGRHDDVNGTTTSLDFYAGSKSKRKTSRLGGGSTYTRTVHTGGVKLELIGTESKDRDEVDSIRDICFHGRSTGGLTLLAVENIAGKRALVLTGTFCKVCKRPMIGFAECGWDICDQDADQCQHNYVRGLVNDEKVGIRVGDFCDKCGRAKPLTEEEEQMSVLDN